MDYSIFGILLLSFICKSSIFKQDFMSNKFYSGDFKFIFPTFRINSLLSGTYLNINCPIPDYFRLSQLLSNTWFLCAISSIFDFFFSFQISHASVRVPLVVFYLFYFIIEIRISSYSWLVVLYVKCFQLLYIYFLIYKCLILNSLKRSI